jgi:acyl-CoA thioester hydrolase
MGIAWFARQSRIDYLTPLHYGDAIDATTFIADYRRVRVQRHYEFVRVSDGALAATAAVDWAFIDRKDGAPKRLPEETMRLYRPEGPDPGARLTALNESFDPPDRVFRARRRALFHEIDEYQHVNNMVYLDYIGQAALDAWAQAGIDLSRMRALGGFFTVRRHDVEYLHPAQYGDTLNIASWTSAQGRSSLLCCATLHDQTGEAVVRAQTRWVWVDLATRKARELPQSIREALWHA